MAYSKGRFASPRGPQLCTHSWLPVGAPRCRVLIMHGNAAHGAFPTVRLLAERLAAAGCAAFSLDFEGHGESEGVAALINDTAHLSGDAAAFARSFPAPQLPLFLAGTSMGGGLALRCSLEAPAGSYAGLLLLSPLITVAEDARPGPLAVAALTALCFFAPQAALLGGSSADAGAQYADPEIRAACLADVLAYKGKMRLGTARALMELSTLLEARLAEVATPFLAFHGTADNVVPVEGSRRLLAMAAATDKTLTEVPGALHTLLGQPEPERGAILDAAAHWVVART